MVSFERKDARLKRKCKTPSCTWARQPRSVDPSRLLRCDKVLYFGFVHVSPSVTMCMCACLCMRRFQRCCQWAVTFSMVQYCFCNENGSNNRTTAVACAACSFHFVYLCERQAPSTQHFYNNYSASLCAAHLYCLFSILFPRHKKYSGECIHAVSHERMYSF